LVTEANTNDNLSPSQFQAWMAKAEQHYEFCDLMRQLLAVLRNRWAEATNADKKTAYLLMGEVVAKEFFGNAGVVITSDGKRAAEATMDWIVDIAKDVATDHLGGLQVVLKEGETLGKTELVGYIRYYKNGQLVRNVEVGAVRPEWAQNVRQGKRTLPLGEIAAGAAHILDTIEVGEGVRSLIELQNEQNAATALTGNLHALLQIAKALAPVGVSQYLGVLDDSLNLSAFEKAYGDTVAVANAKSLLNDGDFLPLNGPLSKAWFIENCPALAVFFRAAGM
jgi:hypothetical protein